MQPLYEFTAVLVIRHPTIDPSRLTQEFRRTPVYSWRAGDSRENVHSEDGADKYRESYWVTSLQPLPLSQLEHFGMSFSAPELRASLEYILWLGALILKGRHELWKRLQAEGASAEILVALVNQDRVNMKLPSDLLGVMANLGLSVSFDVQAYARVAA